MGEVYRARDTRLERSVAIKVLPERLSANPQLRERFAREAKAISNLSHPHICALYDVGQSEGADYLVMELLEGETLADRLAKGPLPSEQVIRYGVQIAEALHAAHRSGIVHRDLKPGNVMLTKSGAKLLDFGLASVGAAAPGSAPEAGAPTQVQATERRPLTEDGVVLGTFQYMAPEQVEGQPADARTDIFALGVTLYEMATGRRAFDGKTRASLIASILDREPPPISSVAPASPLALDRVIRACMAKDPDERWQNAHDVATELRWVGDTSSQMLAERGRRGMSRRALWGAIGAIAGIAVGAIGTWLATRDARPSAPVARFNMALPPQAPLFYGTQPSVAISPDGTRIIYISRSGEEESLYTRGIGQPAPALIPGTEEGELPVFSPDGRSLAFTARGKLKKAGLDGGLPVVIADLAGGSLGICWGGDTIYYVRGFSGGIWSVPAAGGPSKQLIKVDPEHGARAIIWPDLLPDGKTMLTTVWNNGSWDDAKIVAYPLDGGAPKTIIDGGAVARYVPTGHLLYVRGGTLYGVGFDAAGLRVTGAPVALVAGVATGVINGEAHYAVSRNGTLLYAAGGVLENKRTLLWVDRRGNEQPVVPTQRPYGPFAISPDGRTIAVTLETSTFDVWQLDVERDSLSRVSFGGDDSGPAWTPDGGHILFSSSRTGRTNLWWAATDNSSAEQRLVTADDRDEYVNGISPDGRFAAVFQENGGETHNDVALLSLQDRKMQPFLASRFNEADGLFSPDGTWFLYTSDESGARELYIRPFPGPGGKWQVSTGGADGGTFAHNGREILYRHGTKFFTVPLELAPRVRVGKPQFLFEKTHRQGTWDLAKDDQRIMLIRDDTPRTTGQLQIVMNWFEELKRRVPSQ